MANLPPTHRPSPTRLARGRRPDLVAAPWLWFLAARPRRRAVDTVAVGLPLVVAWPRARPGHRGDPPSPLAPAAGRRLRSSSSASCAIVEPRHPPVGPGAGAPSRIAMANVYDGNPAPDAAIAALRRPRRRRVGHRGDGRHVLAASRRHRRAPLPRGVRRAGRARPLAADAAAAAGLPRSRVLRIRVDAPGAPFVLYVAHALNPLHDFSTFADQQAFARSIVAAAAQEQLARVVVGDFNMSDRASAYRIFDGSLRDAMRVRNVRRPPRTSAAGGPPCSCGSTTRSSRPTGAPRTARPSRSRARTTTGSR